MRTRTHVMTESSFVLNIQLCPSALYQYSPIGYLCCFSYTHFKFLGILDYHGSKTNDCQMHE